MNLFGWAALVCIGANVFLYVKALCPSTTQPTKKKSSILSVMFPHFATRVYLCGYTVQCMADLKRLREWHLEDELSWNVVFRIMKTKDCPIDDDTLHSSIPRNCYVAKRPLCQDPIELMPWNGLQLHKHDTDVDLVQNKSAVFTHEDFQQMCRVMNVPEGGNCTWAKHFEVIDIYGLSPIFDGKCSVFKGSDWNIYKDIQGPENAA